MFTGPKQNTVDDFWWMIWQENVEQVVMLTNIMEGDKVKASLLCAFCLICQKKIVIFNGFKIV